MHNPRKYSAAIRISEWQLFDMKSISDPRYRRKVKEVIEHQPTEQDWANYRAAKEAHEFLLESPYFIDGGSDDSSHVEEPEPRREYVYAETTAEWLDRCRELLKADQ